MGGLAAFQLGHHAVELPRCLEQRLLAVEIVLEGLLAVDAVVETEGEDGLARGQVLVGSAAARVQLLLPQLPEEVGVEHVLLVPRQAVVLVGVDLVGLEGDALGVLGVELVPDAVEVELRRQVVDLLGLALEVVDVLGRLLDDLVFAYLRKAVPLYPARMRWRISGVSA